MNSSLQKPEKKKRKLFSFSNERQEEVWFTTDFFKFLLGFSLLILASFTLLALLGLRDSPENLSAPGVHVSSPCAEGQLSQEKC